jgi:DNA-binding transcriptional ArsR family regulator
MPARFFHCLQKRTRLLKRLEKIFAQPNSCTYICNHIVAFMMETRRDMFQALADPTRRAIILLLATAAMTPNAIADHFDSSRQAVSKHLQVLMACEVVRQEAQGREIYYHLNADKMKEIEKWLEQFRQLLAKRFDQLDTVLTHLQTKKP